MLGLKVLRHTGPITWGMNCPFLVSSRADLITRKARGNETDFGIHYSERCAFLRSNFVLVSVPVLLHFPYTLQPWIWLRT